jgi:hypothetical protein
MGYHRAGWWTIAIAAMIVIPAILIFFALKMQRD